MDITKIDFLQRRRFHRECLCVYFYVIYMAMWFKANPRHSQIARLATSEVSWGITELSGDKCIRPDFIALKEMFLVSNFYSNP